MNHTVVLSKHDLYTMLLCILYGKHHKELPALDKLMILCSELEIQAKIDAAVTENLPDYLNEYFGYLKAWDTLLKKLYDEEGKLNAAETSEQAQALQVTREKILNQDKLIILESHLSGVTLHVTITINNGYKVRVSRTLHNESHSTTYIFEADNFDVYATLTEDEIDWLKQLCDLAFGVSQGLPV